VCRKRKDGLDKSKFKSAIDKVITDWYNNLSCTIGMVYLKNERLGNGFSCACVLFI